MKNESKVWTVVIAAGVLVIAAAGLALIFRGQAVPTATVDDTPPPYYYDAERDIYWNPDHHGHWHHGRPPQGAAQPEQPEDFDEMGWLDSLPLATEAARAQNTIILAFFHAEWCGACQRLKAETYTDPAVRKKMGDFILLQVDVDLHEELARRFGVTGVPSTIFLNSEAEEMISRPGFMPPADYLKMLEEAAGFASYL